MLSISYFHPVLAWEGAEICVNKGPKTSFCSWIGNTKSTFQHRNIFVSGAQPFDRLLGQGFLGILNLISVK